MSMVCGNRWFGLRRRPYRVNVPATFTVIFGTCVSAASALQIATAAGISTTSVIVDGTSIILDGVVDKYHLFAVSPSL